MRSEPLKVVTVTALNHYWYPPNFACAVPPHLTSAAGHREGKDPSANQPLFITSHLPLCAASFAVEAASAPNQKADPPPLPRILPFLDPIAIRALVSSFPLPERARFRIR